MKTLEFKVSITMPKGDSLDSEYIKSVIVGECYEETDEGRWTIKVEEI